MQRNAVPAARAPQRSEEAAASGNAAPAAQAAGSGCAPHPGSEEAAAAKTEAPAAQAQSGSSEAAAVTVDESNVTTETYCL